MTEEELREDWHKMVEHTKRVWQRARFVGREDVLDEMAGYLCWVNVGIKDLYACGYETNILLADCMGLMTVGYEDVELLDEVVTGRDLRLVYFDDFIRTICRTPLSPEDYLSCYEAGVNDWRSGDIENEPLLGNRRACPYWWGMPYSAEWFQAVIDCEKGEQRSELRKRRLAVARQKGTPHTREQFEYLCEAVGWRCVRCGEETKSLQVDHIVPISRGGSDSMDNIQPLCGSCNASKKDQVGDWITDLMPHICLDIGSFGIGPDAMLHASRLLPAPTGTTEEA